MTIIEKLDQLAEFQAKRDALEFQKAELLNSVKVPDEVIAAQATANRQRQALDTHLVQIRAELTSQANAQLEAIPLPELPAEYLAAMKKAQEARAAVQAWLADEESAAILQANDTRQKIENDLTAKVGAIFAQVEQRRREIADEFGAKSSAVDDNINKLTAEIKKDVVSLGESVKASVYHAVYTAGRTTWKTDKLDGVYFILNDVLKMIEGFVSITDELSEVYKLVRNATRQIADARKVGEPSVSIRAVK